MQRDGRGRQRAAGRHEVVDQDDDRAPREVPGAPARDPGANGGCRPGEAELAGGRADSLAGVEPGGVGSPAGGDEDRQHPGRRPRPGQIRGREVAEPVDVLTAAGPRDDRVGGHRDQHHPGGRVDGLPSEDLSEHPDQRGGQRARELPATSLLVGQERTADGAGVRARRDHGWQPGGTRVGPGRLRPAQRGQATPAQWTVRSPAADAGGGEKQVAQHSEHGSDGRPPRRLPEGADPHLWMTDLPVDDRLARPLPAGTPCR